MASKIEIKPIGKKDTEWVKETTREKFGADFIFDAGKKKYPYKLPGFIAYLGNEKIGVLTYEIMNGSCEIVTIESLKEKISIGSLLLKKLKETAINENCRRIWLITTNDNLSALNFYQKRGFNISNVYPNAVTKTRETVKPEIPLYGENGIEIKDEIELELKI